MAQLLSEYDSWFDKYGNLVTDHGHLAPSYFGHLGLKFSVKKGCGFSLPESDWLRADKAVKPKEPSIFDSLIVSEGDVYFGVFSRYFGKNNDNFGLIDADKMRSYAVCVTEIAGSEFHYRSFEIHKNGNWKLINENKPRSLIKVLTQEICEGHLVKADESEIRNMPRL